jgi:hypothetical protein
MKEFLQPQEAPELVFGLVAPIGVDLDLVTASLKQSLRDVLYNTQIFKLTDLMLEVETGLAVSTDGSVDSYRQRIAYANAVRKKLGNESLAALAAQRDPILPQQEVGRVGEKCAARTTTARAANCGGSPASFPSIYYPSAEAS